MEHKITLKFGHTDDDGNVHSDVTFGKRLTVADMMALDVDPRCQIRTQYNDIVNSRMITKFGELRIPLDISVLLDLNAIDREDINLASSIFVGQSVDINNNNLYPDEPRVRLAFGFEKDGKKYTEIEMRNLPTGRDEVEADGNGYIGIAHECFMLGRRITQIKTADGRSSLDGPLELDDFKPLDSVDLLLLRRGAIKADLFFRRQRAGVEKLGAGKGSADPEKGNRADGDGNTRNVSTKDANVSGDADGTV